MRPCILIFGMPRSGTTWIGKLFDSHPDTLYRHEPDSVQQLAMPQFPDKAQAHKYAAELQHFITLLPRMRSPKVVGKQPLFAKSYHSTAALHAYQASVFAAKAASRIRRDVPCLYRPTGEGCARTRLVWKSTESPARLSACMAALPEARAIHLLRHPCGYVASILRGRREHRFAVAGTGSDAAWYLNLLLATPAGRACGLSRDDVARFTPEERLALSWVLIQEKILADIAGCERTLSVRYEDVCAQPEATTRRMFAFAGLDWQPQTAAFVAASSGMADTDYYSVFKDSPARAERWRAELAPDVIARILGIAADSNAYRFYRAVAAAPVAQTEVAP